MKTPLLILATLAALCLTGCDSPKNTVEDLKKEIKEFRTEPTMEKRASIEKSFTKLDAQITALQNAGKSDQAMAFADQASSLRADFAAAKVAQTVNDAKNAIQGFGEAVRDAGRSIGDAFRSPSTNATPEENP